MARQNILRPMKAATATIEDIDRIINSSGVVLASYKLDGIRARVVNGKLLSASGKPIPNHYTRQRFEWAELNGFDGELIRGEPNAPDVFRKSHSAVMSADGYPDIKFYVFDNFTNAQAPYIDRIGMLNCKNQHVIRLQQRHIKDIANLQAFENYSVSNGYEGIMVRIPSAPYKFGRATITCGWLMKLKRFADSEAVVLEVKELMHNDNVATINAQGHTERSSHKANKTAAGVMGKLVVQDIHNPLWVFEIGTGYTAEDRKAIWEEREKVKGLLVRYKYFPVGIKDLPRHPVFLGFRDKRDVTK